jgi:hypothetical protein
MSTVSQIGRLSPIAQIQHFWSCTRLLSSLCESTDSVFRRVHVMKRDETGNIKLYKVKNKTTGETKQVGVLSYIEEIRTGEMQLDEPGYIIVIKCAMIALGMPLYTVGKMGWHMFKTPFEISALAINTLIKTGEQLALGRLYEGAVEMRHGFSQVPEIFGEGLFEIIKAPIFALGAELAALGGIVRPYHGRGIEKIIEFAWQKGASYQEDFKNPPPRTGENCWDAFVKDVHDTHPFYLGPCFQGRGNVNDAQIIVIRREAL